MHPDQDLDRRLQRVERLLTFSRSGGEIERQGSTIRRIDPGTPPKPGSRETMSQSSDSSDASPGFESSAWAWSALTIGLAAFMCGMALAAWGWFGSRTELWLSGIPSIGLGLLGVVVGVVWHLDRIWADNLATIERLRRIEDSLEPAPAQRQHQNA
jgi:hypothetical protein